MRTRRTSRRADRQSVGPRSAGRFGLHGQPGLRRRRPGALNPAAQKMRELQEALDAGKIDSDEFESQMEQLEAQQRHSYVGRRAAARRRTARIEPADVMLLQNAIKQFGRSKDADEAVRMLRDIIDAASDMKKELEPKHTARTAGSDDLALLESAIGTLRKTRDEGEKVALLRDIAGAAAEWMKELEG